jgi:hypothetical protein
MLRLIYHCLYKLPSRFHIFRLARRNKICIIIAGLTTMCYTSGVGSLLQAWGHIRPLYQSAGRNIIHKAAE